jgi:hypothetical protein
MLNASLKKFKNRNGYIPISMNCCIDTYFTSETLAEADNYIEVYKDSQLYTTNCTFKSENRSRYNVAEITALYIDIDSHLVTPTDKELEALKEFILEKAKAKIIPYPSSIVDSGRGVHLHFNLKNAADTNLYSLLARALQEKIDTIIKDFDIFYGVENFTQCDKSKKNANDLHRIVGTYNPKANKYAKLLYSCRNTYTLEQLQKDYNLTLKDTKGRVMDLEGLTAEDICIANTKELKEYKGRCLAFTKETLRTARLQDLFSIIRLRNARNILEGYRFNLLTVLLPLLRENNPTINDLLENVREFNNTFKKPLEDKEVINYVAWALQQPKGYQSNRHIISTLGLTEREQTHLKTLINPKLAKKRKNARYYSNSSFYQIIKARNEEKREKAIAKAKDLREQGYKLKDIATALDRTTRTIINYLKEA